MSDFIFPECPYCGEKPSEGDGVGLSELAPDGEFTWYCPSCKFVHRGVFTPNADSVNWISRSTTWARRAMLALDRIYNFCRRAYTRR